MNESTNDLDHSEAEILTVEFSDEAVEAAGSYPMAGITFTFSYNLFYCRFC